MHDNISIHFTVKFTENLDKAKAVLDHLFSDYGLKKGEVTIHHCFARKEFLKSKQIPLSVYDLFESYTSDVVCWRFTENVDYDRERMLKNLSAIGGKAFFISPFVDGVLKEMKCAENFNIDSFEIG